MFARKTPSALGLLAMLMGGCLTAKTLPTHPATMGAVDGVTNRLSGAALVENFPSKDLVPASKLMVSDVYLRPPVVTDLAGVRKLLIIPLAGPEDASTRATSKLIDCLQQTHRFEVLELRDAGEVAQSLNIRPAPKPKNDSSSNKGVLSTMTNSFMNNFRPAKPMETRFEPSGGALTIKDEILKGAQEQGADAILIGEVINYRCADGDPRFRLVTTQSHGVFATVLKSVIDVPMDLLVNLSEWGLNKVGRLWGRTPPAVERTGQVQIACRIIDLRTNSVRMSCEPYQVEVARAENAELLPPQDLVLDHALEKCVRELVSGIGAPPDLLRTELVVTSDLREGVDHARQGRMDQAMMAFEKVLYESPGDHAACYNIGLLEEARGDIDLAARYYNAALAIETNEKYLAAFRRVQRSIALRHELQVQALAAPRPSPAIVLPTAHVEP